MGHTGELRDRGGLSLPRLLGLGILLGLTLGTLRGAYEDALWVPVKRGARIRMGGALPGRSEFQNCRFGVRRDGQRECLQTWQDLEARLPRWQRPFERFRETLSERFRSSDSQGLFRRLILDEACLRESVEWKRLLGWVHLYSAAGVHLDGLAWLIERLAHGSWLLLGARLLGERASRAQLWRRCFGVFRALAFLGLWILSGLRWGLLRPWVSWELGRALKVTGISAPVVGFRLLFSLLLDALLSVDGGDAQELLTGGFLHYAAAVAGGTLGWQAFLELRKNSGHSSGWRSWEGHVWLGVGAWIVPVWLSALEFALQRERGGFPIALATPLLSLASIPFLAFVYLPGLLVAGLLGLLGAPSVAWEAALTWNGKASELLERVQTLLLQVPQLGSLSSVALLGGLGVSVLARLFWRGLPSVRKRLWLVAAILGLALAIREGARSETARGGADVDPSPRAQVFQLDVGQGDAAWLAWTSGERGFWDVGAERAWTPTRWIRFAMREGVSEVSFVGASHADEDHIGGLRRLLRLLPVRCLALSPVAVQEDPKMQKLLDWVENQVPASVRPRVAEFFDCFPGKAAWIPARVARVPRERHRVRPNGFMAGVVVPLVGGGAWVSLGDAEREGERQFLPWLRTLNLESAPVVLKLSHHGSRTSTDPALLELLRPQAAWVSVGARNHFGHPSPGILADLAERRIPWHLTAQEGDLSSEPVSRLTQKR